MVTAERGSLLDRLCLQADISVARRGFNPFPVSHSFLLFLSLIAQTVAQGQALDRGSICEILSLAALHRDVLAVCSLALGKLAAVLLLQGCHLGWDGLSCSALALHPRLFI